MKNKIVRDVLYTLAVHCQGVIFKQLNKDIMHVMGYIHAVYEKSVSIYLIK